MTINTSKIKILIADDHPLIRRGIRTLLECEPDFNIVAEAGDGEEAVRLSSHHKPDVVIMDVGMPKLSGLEATKRIKAENTSVSVLVLSIHDDERYIIELLKAGASGYLIKSAFGDELLHAIRSLCAGSCVLHPIVVQKLVNYVDNYQLSQLNLEGVEQLTLREREVLKLIARGKNNHDIANELNIGTRTVKKYLVDIYAKMGVSSRTEAAIYALQKGWIAPEDAGKEQ